MILGIGPLQLRTQGLHWVSASANTFVVSGSGTLTITNNLPDLMTVRVIHGDRSQTVVASNRQVQSFSYP